MVEIVDIIEDEKWAWIPGYKDKYMVSTKGRVRTFVNPEKTKNKDGFMSQEKTRDKNGELNGHRRVNLKGEDGKYHHCDVSRLVAITFIPNPNNKPIVNHKDNDPSNNCMDNLEWVTSKENTLHAKRSFPDKKQDYYQSVVNITDGQVFQTPQDAAKEYGLTVRTVLHACNTKSPMVMVDLRWLVDRPEYDNNIFLEADSITKCSNCGSPEGLYAPDGSRNKFCGACGTRLNWRKEPGSNEV